MQAYRDFIFQPGSGKRDQFPDIFTDRQTAINQLVVIWNPSKYTVEAYFILIRK